MPEEPIKPAAPETRPAGPSMTAGAPPRERETAISAAPGSPPPATFLDWSGHKLAMWSLIGLFVVIGAFLAILSGGWGCGACSVELPMAEATQVLAGLPESEINERRLSEGVSADEDRDGQAGDFRAQHHGLSRILEIDVRARRRHDAAAHRDGDSRVPLCLEQSRDTQAKGPYLGSVARQADHPA